jgi:hypothetical protein
MKNLILFLCLIAQCSFAQTKNEKEVLMNVERLRKAMVEADVATMKSLTASTLSYGHSSGVIENQDEFINAVVNGSSKMIAIEHSNVTTSFSKDVATVRMAFNAQMKNQKGEISQLKINVLQVWQKQKGQWFLLARQGFRTPPPVNP